MTDWLLRTQWHLSDVFYYRFFYYEDDLDRLAFFKELSYGWLEMYAEDELWRHL